MYVYIYMCTHTHTTEHYSAFKRKDLVGVAEVA